MVLIVTTIILILVHTGRNLEWNRTVYEQIHIWELMVEHLLVRSTGHPVLLVHYKDLKSNALHEVVRILSFLDYEVSNKVVEERLKKQFNTFYRNHTSTFEHFTRVQRDYVNTVISRVESRLPGVQLR